MGKNSICCHLSFMKWILLVWMTFMVLIAGLIIHRGEPNILRYLTPFQPYKDIHLDNDTSGTLNRALLFHETSGIAKSVKVKNHSILVHGYGDFFNRIKLYNIMIENVSKEALNETNYNSWSNLSAEIIVVWGAEEDFLGKLSKFNTVKTVALAWMGNRSQDSWSSHNDTRNLLLQTYYGWAGTDPLCQWINTQGGTKVRWDAVYNRGCSTNMMLPLSVKSLEPLYLNGMPIYQGVYWPNEGNSYPLHFYNTPPPYVFYMHVIKAALITNGGDIFTNNLKLVPYTCSHDRSTDRPQHYEQSHLYQEVFIMSGKWGVAYYHRIAEQLPRLVPYLDFLIGNPRIRIHVSETTGLTAKILKMLGISSNRLVAGLVRAKVAYMPQGTGCGFAQVQGSQILSHLFRGAIKRNLSNTIISQSSKLDKIPKQQYLIMIHRSWTRKFLDAEKIEHRVQELAKEFKLQYILFDDRHLPTFEDTLMIFNKAVMVVAPHGGGLSNVISCEPGTFIIEGVCNRPHVNMCYQRLSHILGMRYHGIPSEKGCEGYNKIDPKTLASIVRYYLQQWQKVT